MPRGTNIDRSEHYGALQRIVDALFWEADQPDCAAGGADDADAAGASRDGVGTVRGDAGAAWSAAGAEALARNASDSFSATAPGESVAGAGMRGAAAAASVGSAPAAEDTSFGEADPYAHEGTFAQRLGISDRTAALLGLAAFDEEVGMTTALNAPIPEEPEEFTVRRLDVVIAAEAADLPDELMRVVNLLPPGDYTRQKLCDQINSAITGHAWGQVYGTVS